MRAYCILLLLVVLLVIPDTDAWGRRRRRRRGWRRFTRRIGRAVRNVGRFVRRVREFADRNRAVIDAGIRILGRRDLETMTIDANKDGTIDHSEAMTLINEERAARDLLSLADEDGDSVVSVDEFERSVREIMLMDADELDQDDDDDDFSE